MDEWRALLLTLEKWRQEDPKFKVTFSYIGRSRPGWAARDSISKKGGDREMAQVSHCKPHELKSTEHMYKLDTVVRMCVITG